MAPLGKKYIKQKILKPGIHNPDGQNIEKEGGKTKPQKTRVNQKSFQRKTALK